MKIEFEHVGYHLDFYIDKKYMGSCRCDHKDREVYGYDGRKTEVMNEDVILRNNKLIKKGTIVITELIPLCGKVINREEIMGKIEYIIKGTKEFDRIIKIEGWVNEKDEPISSKDLSKRKSAKKIRKTDYGYSILITSGYWFNLTTDK